MDPKKLDLTQIAVYPRGLVFFEKNLPNRGGTKAQATHEKEVLELLNASNLKGIILEPTHGLTKKRLEDVKNFFERNGILVKVNALRC